MNVRLVVGIPLLCAGGLAAPASAGLLAETVYTLYRESWVAPEPRVHVATFDAARPTPERSASYNMDHCNRVARMLNEQPGSASKFWCEPGRYRGQPTADRQRSVRPRSRQDRRSETAAGCSSALAARTATPDDLATACRGWSPLQIARAEVQYFSGLCKADSVPDCDRLCFHAPHDLPSRERTKIASWACRRRSELTAQTP